MSNNIGSKVGLAVRVLVLTRAVPVTGDGLRVEGDDDTELLAHSLEQVPGQPQLVSPRDTLAWAHLVLPLAGQYLTVDTGDVDSSIKRSTVVCLSDVPAERVLGSYGAIVRTLGTGVTAC